MDARFKTRAKRVPSEIELLALGPAKIARVLQRYSEEKRNQFGTLLCNLVSTLRARVSQENRNLVETILEGVLNPERKILDEAVGLKLKIECASYFDLLGDYERSINICKEALVASKIIDNKNLQRRAHNVLLSVYIKNCQFKDCFYHLDESFKLVREIKDPILEMAALANAAALLGDMGLVTDAINLADRISNIPVLENKCLYCFLQLQNACNALRLYRRCNNEKANIKYFEIACANIAPAKDAVDDVTRAHFEWIRAVYLVERGEMRTASGFVDIAMADANYKRNDATLALLTMAKAECLMASRRNEDVDHAIDLLRDVLPRIQSHSSFYEDVLRTLIPALFRANRAEHLEAATHYSQVLRSHLVNVKHRAFYLNLRSDTGADKAIDVLADPSYTLPIWINYSSSISAADDSSNSESREEYSSRSPVIPIDFTETSFEDSDSLGRPGYRVSAESWAIAAEFSAGRDGLHCFRAASISREIGLALGFTRESCKNLEFVVRLHDIGKIAVDESVLRLANVGAADPYRSIVEHTTMGERLLSGIPDPLMVVAAKVARQHHEWWSGSGLPDGLTGDEICVEARICAVADTYLNLIDPVLGLPVWSSERAKQQLTTMAGLHLDPALVDIFVNAIPDSTLSSCLGPATFDSLRQNAMLCAKAKLFNTLDLVSRYD